jgi:hypothetical protein
MGAASTRTPTWCGSGAGTSTSWVWSFIGDRLTEVNVTSPTGIREIDALAGAHLASDVTSRAEGRCRAATGTA